MQQSCHKNVNRKLVFASGEISFEIQIWNSVIFNKYKILRNSKHGICEWIAFKPQHFVTNEVKKK